MAFRSFGTGYSSNTSVTTKCISVFKTDIALDCDSSTQYQTDSTEVRSYYLKLRKYTLTMNKNLSTFVLCIQIVKGLFHISKNARLR